MHAADTRTGRSPRQSSRGFILVMLLVFITAMGIFLTVALPRVATEIQRDQEAELIFRGEAIANAIRLYKAKTGTYPASLEDLTKFRPPILRKLYLDPMTSQGGHEGDWDLITAVQPGASGDKTGLPIVGVRSHCQKDSFATYHEKTLISDWTFSAADNLLGVAGSSSSALTAAASLLTGSSASSSTAVKAGPDPSELTGPTGAAAQQQQQQQQQQPQQQAPSAPPDTPLPDTPSTPAPTPPASAPAPAPTDVQQN